jgi:hypothetical protein
MGSVQPLLVLAKVGAVLERSGPYVVLEDPDAALELDHQSGQQLVQPIL